MCLAKKRYPHDRRRTTVFDIWKRQCFPLWQKRHIPELHNTGSQLKTKRIRLLYIQHVLSLRLGRIKIETGTTSTLSASIYGILQSCCKCCYRRNGEAAVCAGFSLFSERMNISTPWGHNPHRTVPENTIFQRNKPNLKTTGSFKHQCRTEFSHDRSHKINQKCSFDILLFSANWRNLAFRTFIRICKFFSYSMLWLSSIWN